VAGEQERLSSDAWAPPWIRHEHYARYRFAAGLVNGGCVVDCACGDGTSSVLLAARAECVRAFDVDAEAIECARARHATPNLSFAVADATCLPVGDGTAHAYVSLETIEHLPDHEAFLSEAVRVLDPRHGVFICSTPDREVYSPGDAAFDRPWNRFHVREHSAQEFVDLLNGSFGSVDLYGQNPKSPRLTNAKYRLGSVASPRLAVAMNQMLKLPRLLYDRPERHEVVPVQRNRRYEYLVAVCR
jgi:SAM-dependent methyltransferase